MKPGKSFSSRKSSSGGRGRTTKSRDGKKSFGKRNDGDKKFPYARGESKPFKKRDDSGEKTYGDRAKPYQRSDDRNEFKKPFEKKFTGRAKPFSKRDDRDEKPYGDRAKPFQRSGDRNDFKKPYEKKSTGRAKPVSKRDDRDEKPYGDGVKPYRRSEDRKDFKKPFDKKFSGRTRPVSKGDDRDEKPYGDREKPFQHSDDKNAFKKTYGKKFSGKEKPFIKREDSDEKPFGDRKKSFESPDDRKDFKKPYEKKISGKAKSFIKRDDEDNKPDADRSETFHPSADGKDFVKREAFPSERPKRKRKDESFSDTENQPEFSDSESRSDNKADFKERKRDDNNNEEAAGESDRKWNRKSGHEFYGDRKKTIGRGGRNDRKEKKEYLKDDDGSIRLNKYISNSGICSRREADELITAGVVSVNGEIMTQLGYKVKPGDEVKYNNETLRAEKLVYILVNKPKDFITTVDDPQDRKTVMWLIKDACRERVYPVGRLDRNTTGVLLFTNDGELAKKLTHPSFEVQKIYQVELDSPLKSSDMEQIGNGLNMEDGFIKVDDIAYSAAGKDKSVVGVELHSGKNRIVRRIFEHFGYYIKKLDRVYFAGLSKKDLPRGRWRFLTPIEVSNLKMMTGNKKMQKYYEA